MTLPALTPARVLQIWHACVPLLGILYADINPAWLALHMSTLLAAYGILSMILHSAGGGLGLSGAQTDQLLTDIRTIASPAPAVKLVDPAPAPIAPAGGGQAGFALFRTAALFVALGASAAALAACAEWQAAATAANSEVVGAAHNAANDALIGEAEAMCGTPYSAVVRNTAAMPGLPTALKALCGDIPAGSIPASLMPSALGVLQQPAQTAGPAQTPLPAAAATTPSAGATN